MYTPSLGSGTYPGQNQALYNMGNKNAQTPSPTNPAYPAIDEANNGQSVQDQSLLSLSDAFMDSHFLDMDRVITFEDASFFLPGDAFRWQ